MCFLTVNEQKRITILKYTGTRYVHKLNLTITKTTVNNKVIQALKAKSYLKKICFEKRFKGQNRIGIFNGNVNVISNVMLNYDAISGVCITNRPLHGHLEIQNFSFGLKDISWMSTMNKWNIFQQEKTNFVSPSGFVRYILHLTIFVLIFDPIYPLPHVLSTCTFMCFLVKSKIMFVRDIFVKEHCFEGCKRW